MQLLTLPSVSSNLSCLLCTYTKDCHAGGRLFLDPTTPIVGQLLVAALNKAGLAFSEERALVVLAETITDEALSKAVQAHLSPRETDDIRIGRLEKSATLRSEVLTAWLRHTDTSWFDRALEADQFTTFFQPIVDGHDGKIHGHECLVRLFADRAYNGGEIMEAAVQRGRTHIFDSYMRQLSVRTASAQHEPGTKVFINFLPSSIYDPAFCMKSTFEAMKGTDLKPADIVFEVVESEHVHDPRHLKKICDYYRQHGFGFALDDVGTGSNSLQMVCDLSPDYIKIDKSLISGLGDAKYRTAVRKIAELAQEFNVRVIAEGIEDPETAHTCLDLGIRYMQGYFYAKPQASMVSHARDLINLAQTVGYCESRKQTQQPTPAS